jgi:hypothetical protein
MTVRYVQVLHQIIIVTMFSFRKGIAVDRLVGFQDLGGKDDFTTKALEVLLIKKGNTFVQRVLHCLTRDKSLNHHYTGIISEKKEDEDGEDDGCHENRCRSVRSSFNPDSDSE